jgi:hypothetical protein
MRKLSLLFTVVCLSLSFAGIANAQAVQIFGGYSYLRPPVDLSTTLNTNPNLNGWELSGTYNAWKWLGATADFSGDYGTTSGFGIHEQNYLFGPQVHLPGPVSPFAHVLIGGASETIGSLSADSVAVAAGAGIDIHMGPFVSVRPIQLDYLVTRFRSSTQSQPRVSAGVVIHF